jgi:hypothetical protein
MRRVMVADLVCTRPGGGAEIPTRIELEQLLEENA